jgi:hypothetical protein
VAVVEQCFPILSTKQRCQARKEPHLFYQNLFLPTRFGTMSLLLPFLTALLILPASAADELLAASGSSGSGADGSSGAESTTIQMTSPPPGGVGSCNGELDPADCAYATPSLCIASLKETCPGTCNACASPSLAPPDNSNAAGPTTKFPVLNTTYVPLSSPSLPPPLPRRNPCAHAPASTADRRPLLCSVCSHVG